MQVSSINRITTFFFLYLQSKKEGLKVTFKNLARLYFETFPAKLFLQQMYKTKT